jgi:hypothetical protein
MEGMRFARAPRGGQKRPLIVPSPGGHVENSVPLFIYVHCEGMDRELARARQLSATRSKVGGGRLQLGRNRRPDC